MTKLVINYRSHSSLLHLYSTIFYHGELVPAADIDMTHSLLNWAELPNRAIPLLFHGVIVIICVGIDWYTNIQYTNEILILYCRG